MRPICAAQAKSFHGTWSVSRFLHDVGQIAAVVLEASSPVTCQNQGSVGVQLLSGLAAVALDILALVGDVPMLKERSCKFVRYSVEPLPER
jgi:hypothetical protein